MLHIAAAMLVFEIAVIKVRTNNTA